MSINSQMNKKIYRNFDVRNQVTVLVSKRSIQMIIYNGYKYNFKYKALKHDSYICAFVECNVRLSVNDEKVILINGLHKHTKLSNSEIEYEIARNNLKKEALSSHENPKQLIINYKKNMDNFQNLLLPNDKPLISLIKNYRILDKNNKKNHEIINGIPEFLYRTINDKKFIRKDLYDLKHRRHIIIIDEEKELYFKESTNWICDGTFYVSPRGFYQVYTIMITVYGKNIVACYLLLPSKDKSSYIFSFNAVKNLFPQLKVKNIIIDNECAAKLAFKEVFPHVSIFYCIFHFGKLAYLKLQQNKISYLYDTDIQFRNFIRYFLSLILVPVDKLLFYFEAITFLFLQVYTDPGCIKFVEYINGYIANKNKSEVLSWSAHHRIKNFIPLTTNICESNNWAMKRDMDCAHPALVNFIEKIREREYNSLCNLKKQMLEFNPKKNESNYVDKYTIK